MYDSTRAPINGLTFKYTQAHTLLLTENLIFSPSLFLCLLYSQLMIKLKAERKINNGQGLANF